MEATNASFPRPIAKDKKRKRQNVKDDMRKLQALNTMMPRPSGGKNKPPEHAITRTEVRGMLKDLARAAPNAPKGSAAYKVYKLFQTKDDRLLEQALGVVMRQLDPYTYFKVQNFGLDAYVRTILARSRYCRGLDLIAATDGTGDKYCFVRFNPNNPLAPISILKQSSKVMYTQIPAIKEGDGPGCNYDTEPFTLPGTIAGTLGATPCTTFTPIVHGGIINGSSDGTLVGLCPAANKKEVATVATDGSSTGYGPVKGLTGKFAGMIPIKSGDSFRVTWDAGQSSDWYFNALFQLTDGSFTWGTVSYGPATRTSTLVVSAPANSAYGVPVFWAATLTTGTRQSINSILFSTTNSSWNWETQYGDYADDVYTQMLNYCVNGYKFVITPENADAYKSGYTEIVRVPFRSHYTAPRDPTTYWNAIRQTQGLEQRSASMAGSSGEGEGVSGFITSGTLGSQLYSRADVPDPFETTIFAFRQPSPNGAPFQDTTMEISIDYCYQFQPALYNQQNNAEYFPCNPQAEALGQAVLCKMKWFTCNPGHGIFEKAAGWLNDAKNKLGAYGAAHPEVAPKILEALTAVGMSLL